MDGRQLQILLVEGRGFVDSVGQMGGWVGLSKNQISFGVGVGCLLEEEV